MAATASRLGSAPITIDWSHILKKHDVDSELVGEAWGRLKQRFNPKDVGFYDSPIQNDISQAHESQALAEAILKRGEFTDCLFLGIGGSALGPISLLSSLQEKKTTNLRFHFIENPDPHEWKSTLSQLRPDTTLVVPVTKSGTTFETMAQTLLALEWLGKPRWKTHMVIITDPTQGDLRNFATQEQIPSLSIAPCMGGRFSVFSPVGLFPAALAGLSVQSILSGAKQVRDYMEKTPVEKNPIFILGSELIRNYPKRPIHVCMPYSTRLRLLGTWFVQLWGESLGKDGKGFTPVAAVGATDQHSILQLLRDGPDDKVVFFLTVDQVDDEVKLPKSPVTTDRKNYPAFRILEGHTLQELLNIEYRATSLVLTKQARPHITLGLDRLDERSLGALYFAFSTLTAFTGTLWGINPFDQPGVEEGKVYIRHALNEELSRPPAEENTAVMRLRRE
jgi:glucose-6-phosphate isomerase